MIEQIQQHERKRDMQTQREQEREQMKVAVINNHGYRYGTPKSSQVLIQYVGFVSFFPFCYSLDTAKKSSLVSVASRWSSTTTEATARRWRWIRSVELCV